MVAYVRKHWRNICKSFVSNPSRKEPSKLNCNVVVIWAMRYRNNRQKYSRVITLHHYTILDKQDSANLIANTWWFNSKIHNQSKLRLKQAIFRWHKSISNLHIFTGFMVSTNGKPRLLLTRNWSLLNCVATRSISWPVSSLKIYSKLYANCKELASLIANTSKELLIQQSKTSRNLHVTWYNQLWYHWAEFLITFPSFQLNRLCFEGDVMLPCRE